MKDKTKYYHTGWLYASALVILLIGGTVTYLLSQQGYNPQAHKAMIVCLAGTIIGIGVCLISATSDWWLHK